MYHIIINPASHSGKGQHIWEQVIKPCLEAEKISYISYFSEKKGDVTRFAEEITKEPLSDTSRKILLIVLGGDGTVNEVIQGLSDPSRVILGYIPTGSSNDLARDLKLPRDPKKMLSVILHSADIHTMDLGTVTSDNGQTRRFAVSCGIGFDAAVCEETFRSRHKQVLNRLCLGKLSYLAIALKQLFSAKAVSCRLSLDEGPAIDIDKALFVAGMVHRYEGGGFCFCPKAADNDGVLDLCAVGNLPKFLVLFALPTAFFGKHYLFKGVNAYRATKYTLETSSPLWVHTDGEVSFSCNRITVSCLQESLQILVPGRKK